jgi:hypothetical protein
MEQLIEGPKEEWAKKQKAELMRSIGYTGQGERLRVQETEYRAGPVRERKVHEIEKCKYNQRLILTLQSDNEEEVIFMGCTGDAVIVRMYNQPFCVAIRYEQIKSYKVQGTNIKQ